MNHEQEQDLEDEEVEKTFPAGEDVEIPKDEELTYSEILSTLTLNGEVIITIPFEEETKVKTGLKNLKAKQGMRLKEEGLPVPEETLEFYSTTSEEYEDCTNLHIVLKKKGTVMVKKMIIPDNEF